MKAKFTSNETVAAERHEVNYDFSQYGVWKNVTLTIDGINACIYIDGVLVSTGPMPYNPKYFSRLDTTHLTFGGTWYSNDLGTPCYMDNLKIYSKALTAEEIKTEYATENPVPEQQWFVTELKDVELAEALG
jgi:hypothetical protein